MNGKTSFPPPLSKIPRPVAVKPHNIPNDVACSPPKIAKEQASSVNDILPIKFKKHNANTTKPMTPVPLKPHNSSHELTINSSQRPPAPKIRNSSSNLSSYEKSESSMQFKNQLSRRNTLMPPPLANVLIGRNVISKQNTDDLNKIGSGLKLKPKPQNDEAKESEKKYSIYKSSRNSVEYNEPKKERRNTVKIRPVLLKVPTKSSFLEPIKNGFRSEIKINEKSSGKTSILRDFPSCEDSGRIAMENSTVECLLNAIEEAKNGTTIFVPEGTYEVSLVISKSLKFVSKENNACFIPKDNSSCISSNSNYISFVGFKFERKEQSNNSLIVINDGAALFENCDFNSVKSPFIFDVKGHGYLMINNSKFSVNNSSYVNVVQFGNFQCNSCKFMGENNLGVILRDQSSAQFKCCAFEKSTRSAITSTDYSNLVVDDCTFTNTVICVLNTKNENRISNCSFKNSYGQTSVICGSVSTVEVSECKFTSGSLDTRGKSIVHSSNNRFNNSSLYVWEFSKTESYNDSFTGEVSSSIAVFQKANFILKHGKLNGINGCGLLAYGSSETEIEFTQFNDTRDSSIFCHSGAKISISDCEISKSQNTAIIIQDSPECIINHCNISGNTISGLEIFQTNNFIIKESKFLQNRKCGIAINESKGKIFQTQFNSNDYSGIHVSESEIEIEKGQFCFNKICGIFTTGNCNCKFTSSTFDKNGQFAISNNKLSTLTISTSNFTENTNGIISSGKLIITKSFFSKHSSNAIQINDGDCSSDEIRCENNHIGILVNKNSLFKDNKSMFTGNDIQIYGIDESKIEIISSRFTKANYSAIIKPKAFCTFFKCSFSNKENAGLKIEGKLEINECHISSCSNGIIFEENSIANVCSNRK